MAYTAVPTKNTGDTWTASDHNTYLRDNMAAMPPDVFAAKGDLFAATGADAGARLAVGTNGQVLVADSSQATGLRWGAANGGAVAARYKIASTQSLADFSNVVINFATSVYDTDSAVTTGANWRFTAPTGKAGYYLVTVMAFLQSSASWEANERCVLYLYKNNALYSVLGERFMTATGTYNVSVSGMGMVYLAAGDYIDVRINQNSDASITLDSDGDRTHIAIARLFG